VVTHKTHQAVNNNNNNNNSQQVNKALKVLINSVDSHHLVSHPSVSHHISSLPSNNNNSSPNNKLVNNNHSKQDNNSNNKVVMLANNNKAANKVDNNNNHKVFHNSHQASVDSQDSVDLFLHSEDLVATHSSHHLQVQSALDSQAHSLAQLPHSEEDSVESVPRLVDLSEVPLVASQASDQLVSVAHQSVLQSADTQEPSLHTTHCSVVLVESMAHIQDSHSEVFSKVDNNNKVDSNNNKVPVKQANNKESDTFAFNKIII